MAGLRALKAAQRDRLLAAPAAAAVDARTDELTPAAGPDDAARVGFVRSASHCSNVRSSQRSSA